MPYDNYNNERRTNDRYLSERRTNERRPSERRTNERRPSERRTNERRPSERRMNERRPSERRMNERQPSERRPKKNTGKKIISLGLAVVLSASLGAAIKNAFEYLQGEKEIVQKFERITSSYPVQVFSEGFVIHHQGVTATDNETFYQFVDEMAELARENGMSDEEIYIGLEAKISSQTSETYFGHDLSFSEKDEVCKAAYDESQLNEMGGKHNGK